MAGQGTTVYFVRHAQADNTVREPLLRPLTNTGRRDARRIPDYFREIPIDAIYSSPFRRAVETVEPLARERGMRIIAVDGLKERRSDSVQTIPHSQLLERQWEDDSFTLGDGECLEMVRERNIRSLEGILAWEQGRTVVIGTHGMALCTILRHYGHLSGKEEMTRLLETHPYIIRLRFDGQVCREAEEVGQVRLRSGT